MLKKVKNLKLIVGIILVLILCALLFSCEKHVENKKLKNYVVNLKLTLEKKAHKTKIAPLQLPQAITYHADSLRSPFQNSDSSPVGKKGNTEKPLQNYPVSMLKFVGTEFQNNTAFAYLVTPDGKIYQVKVGDMLGDHNGKVTGINSDQLTVTEKNNHTVTLQLKEENK